MRSNCNVFLLLALTTLPCWADGMPTSDAMPDRKSGVATKAAPVQATPAKRTPTKPDQTKPVLTKAAPTGPDDLSAPAIRHVAVCPPPKIAPCVMKRPMVGGYRVLTSGVDVADDGANWVVDFGKGPKGALFLIQALDMRGSLHDIEVSFRSKPGMQRTPTLPEE